MNTRLENVLDFLIVCAFIAASLLLVNVLTGCVSTPPEQQRAQPALYRCDSAETTCGSDGRVCFTWCEKDEAVCTDVDPVFTICGDREACEATCVMVRERCE